MKLIHLCIFICLISSCKNRGGTNGSVALANEQRSGTVTGEGTTCSMLALLDDNTDNAPEDFIAMREGANHDGRVLENLPVGNGLTMSSGPFFAKVEHSDTYRTIDNQWTQLKGLNVTMGTVSNLGKISSSKFVAYADAVRDQDGDWLDFKLDLLESTNIRKPLGKIYDPNSKLCDDAQCVVNYVMVTCK